MNNAKIRAANNNQKSRDWLPTITLILLTVSYGFSYFDRMLMVVVGELVKIEFALSDKQLSFLTGLSFLTIYGLSAIAAGWLLDRYNRKAILLTALALWSTATMTCGLAANFIQLAFARAGVGITEAPSLPAALSILADTHPLKKLPMANAILFVGSTVGMLAAFFIGAWLAKSFGWRFAFLAAGPPGFILMALMLVLVREPERKKIGDGASTDGAGNSFALILRNKPLLWVLIGGGLSNYAHIGILQWLPNFFIRSHNIAPAEIGFYFGPAMPGGMAVGMLLGGWIGNRAAAHSVPALLNICVAALTAVVPLYLLVLWIPSFTAALALTFMSAVAVSIYSPCYNVAWQAIVDPRARGTAAGISGYGSSLVGGAVCPFIVGALSDLWAPGLGAESLRYALTVGLVFCLIGAAVFFHSSRLVRSTPGIVKIGKDALVIAH